MYIIILNNFIVMERVKMLSWDKVSLVVPEREDIDIWYKWINDIETQSFLWEAFWSIIMKKYEEEKIKTIGSENIMMKYWWN